MAQDESSGAPRSEILAENERLRRENARLAQEVEVAKKQIRSKVQRIHTENDALKRDNIRLQMLIAEVKRIRDVRASLDNESSTLADEYDVLAEENGQLREKLARSQKDVSPLVQKPERVEPGKLMTTPRHA